MGNTVSIEAFKEKLLEVLKYSISFFDKHDINWFIACGSALGAVRHKGFIPWDDDIDIYIPRKDYNKLLSLRGEMVNDGYRFICMEDEGYCLAFGKVMDNRTTLWSQRKYPVNFGVYIDVFPLDLTDIGMMSFGIKWANFRLLYSQYRAKSAKITFGCIMDDIKKRNWDNTRTLLAKLALSVVSKKALRKRLEDIERSWNKEAGDRYVSYSEAGMYMFPREWFEEFIIVPFEGIMVRIPKHYHEYLTYMYGDYMTPPPPEKRHLEGPHSKYYVNLEKNIPLKEIKRRKRNK